MIATNFDGTGAPFRYLVEDHFGRVVGEAIDLASDGVEANMPDQRLRPLIERYQELLSQNRTFSAAFGIA